MDKSIEERMDMMEAKLDTIMEMVSVGKHVVLLAKVIVWLGTAYLGLETYIKTVLNK